MTPNCSFHIYTHKTEDKLMLEVVSDTEGELACLLIDCDKADELANGLTTAAAEVRAMLKKKEN